MQNLGVVFGAKMRRSVLLEHQSRRLMVAQTGATNNVQVKKAISSFSLKNSSWSLACAWSFWWTRGAGPSLYLHLLLLLLPQKGYIKIRDSNFSFFVGPSPYEQEDLEVSMNERLLRTNSINDGPSKTPKTDKTRAEIYERYGLKK